MSFLSKIAPQWALNREVARQRFNRLKNLDVKRTQYGSTTRNRMNFDFRAPLTTADSAIDQSRATWRRKTRMLEMENPFVSGPIKRIANNVVGVGFTLISKTKDIELTKKIESYYTKWSLMADIRRISTMSNIMATAQAAISRDGEVLIIGRESKYQNRLIPYCLEVLEIDRLQTPGKYQNDMRFKDGIKYDDDGAPVEYYI